MFKCDCCGEMTLSEKDLYDICRECGWEDDPAALYNPDEESGPNHMTLHEAQSNYGRLGVCKPDQQAWRLNRVSTK